MQRDYGLRWSVTSLITEILNAHRYTGGVQETNKKK
jgi:hypothetical protein